MKGWARASRVLNEASQNIWDTMSEVASPHAVPRFSLSSSCLSSPYASSHLGYFNTFILLNAHMKVQ